jgi:hypothetical protein
VVGLRCLIFIPTYNEAENVEALYRRIELPHVVLPGTGSEPSQPGMAGPVARIGKPFLLAGSDTYEN